MIRILDRYVAREFTRLFLLFAVAAPLLFVLGDLTDNLDRYMDRSITPEAVALSYVYHFPLFVLYSFPIASLIGTVFTVNNMTRHSELSAAKAGGISFWRLLAPLPILGVLLTLVALGLSELVPITTRMRTRLLERGGNENFARTDFVYLGQDGYVFAIRRIDLEGQVITGLVVEREGDEPSIPSLYVKAQDAVYDSVRGWTARHGTLRLLYGEEERHFEFRELISRRFQETPQQLLAQPKDTDEMRYRELSQFIETKIRSGSSPLELMVERAQKIAIPVATLIIVLFGAPLANSTQRGGPAYGIGISLGITIVYLMLFRIFGAAGSTGTLDPNLAAWLPNGLVFLAAMALTLRVKT
ncbi:MAG: LptF/LptG family permease [Longimicrobiales bacterium]